MIFVLIAAFFLLYFLACVAGSLITFFNLLSSKVAHPEVVMVIFLIVFVMLITWITRKKKTKRIKKKTRR